MLPVIRGSFKPKPIPQRNPLAEIDELKKTTKRIVENLDTTKKTILTTVEKKVSEVSKTIDKNVELTTEALDSVQNVKNEVEEAISNIKDSEPGEPGQDAEPVDEDSIIKRVLAQIPEPETLNFNELVKKVIAELPKQEPIDLKKLKTDILKSLPKKKEDLKIIQETVEVDPMSVIEKIMALPEGKFKLKQTMIDGLEQTMSAFRSQLGRGYLHGGGDTVKAGTGITITKNPDGTKIINSTGSGGGDYTPEGVTTATVGGLSAGTDLGTTPIPISTVLNDMLYPALYPTLIAPSNTFTLTESGNHEAGDTIATLHFTAGFNRGSISPAYGTNGYRSGLPNAYNYTGSGLSSPIASTSLTDSETVSSYVVTLGSQSWTSTVSYDAGQQPKDSTGANYSTPLGAGTTGSQSVSITGIFPYYWGVGAQALNVTTDGGGLTKVVATTSSSFSKTYTTSGNVPYLCYPVSEGALTTIKDQNGFTVTSDWTRTTVTITNSFSVAVSCYRYEFNNVTSQVMAYTFIK